MIIIIIIIIFSIHTNEQMEKMEESEGGDEAIWDFVQFVGLLRKDPKALIAAALRMNWW